MCFRLRFFRLRRQRSLKLRTNPQHWLLLLSSIISSRMVKTRGGSDVVFTATSYGRVSRDEESKRWRRKCKAQLDVSEGVTTPRRTVTHSRAQLVDSLATPPSVFRAAVVTTPTQTTPRTLRPLHDGRRKPRCSDFGRSWHYLFQGRGFFLLLPLWLVGFSSSWCKKEH